jgi:hypothetical protein
MDPVDLVFWLDALSVRHGADARVLCRRHADSMVVPRGWTLDDLREPDLRLFRPPPAATSPAHERQRRRAGRASGGAEQLALGATADPVEAAPAAHPEPAPAGAAPLEATAAAPAEPAPPQHVADAPGADPGTAPWVPEFDADDDLDGLLSARSPLLARAFRGADRPR